LHVVCQYPLSGKFPFEAICQVNALYVCVCVCILECECTCHMRMHIMAH